MPWFPSRSNLSPFISIPSPSYHAYRLQVHLTTARPLFHVFCFLWLYINAKSCWVGALVIVHIVTWTWIDWHLTTVHLPVLSWSWSVIYRSISNQHESVHGVWRCPLGSATGEVTATDHADNNLIPLAGNILYCMLRWGELVLFSLHYHDYW